MVKKTPLVFTPNGGMSIETNQFYMRLSQMLCEKSDVSYSDARHRLNGNQVLISIEYPLFV